MFSKRHLRRFSQRIGDGNRAVIDFARTRMKTRMRPSAVGSVRTISGIASSSACVGDAIKRERRADWNLGRQRSKARACA
jgi:hypothetical protein